MIPAKGEEKKVEKKKRNLTELKPLAALLWILSPALGTACGFFGSKAVALANMTDMTALNLESDEAAENYALWFWGVDFDGEHVQADLIGKYIIITVILGILAIAGVVALMVMTGCFDRDEDGRPRLNWFDRLWTEIHLALGIVSGVGGVMIFMPLAQMWPAVTGQGYTPSMPNDYEFGINNKLLIGLVLTGAYFCLLIMSICAVTLVKKLKAGQFLRDSLCGKVIFAICRGIRHIFRVLFKSGGSLRKYVLIAIGMVILAMSWVGAAIDLVLIFIFIPKFYKKFRTISDGVKEVKAGNLTYKIPVDQDEKGPLTGLDELASDINEISQATNTAVQNELKNQRLKTDLISNVSHDLKTPLTSMITYVDLLKTEGLDSENAPEYLDIIEEKTKRLKSLTENLFEAAKASSGNIPCEITDIDISAIVNQALAEMDDRLAARDLNVIVKNDLEDPMVRADGQLLWRVIENLLSNVSKYALEGSRVYINLSNSSEAPAFGNGHVLLEVKNVSQEPLNIPADELMERFTRGDESRNTEGSGLGLAIAKDLTHLMGGVFELTVDGDLFKASVMLEKA